ncbi:MAG: Gfo/Idh/MocA family protein [Microbacteriaceae bacterium]|jgi:predicted dehydrogenase
MKKARIAVVGAGGIGAAAHLPAVIALGEIAELVAIVDLDEARRTAAGETFGPTSLYADLAVMLEEQRPDIVVIATPPHLHEPLAIQAMRAGSWVFCEKPLTGSLESTDRILAAEKETGQWCVTVSQFRYSGGSRQVFDAVKSGTWGKPLVGVAHTSWYRGPEYWDAAWRGKFATEFAGATTSQAHHAIDLLLWIMGGQWQSVSGIADTLSRPIEVEDTSVATVRFDSGAVATLLSTVLSHNQVTKLQVMAERATIDLDTLYMPLLEEWSVRSVDTDGVTQVVEDWAKPEGPVQAHRAQLAHLIGRWSVGEKPELTTEEARSTLEFLTALYKSSAVGRPVARGEIAAGDPFYSALDAAGPERAARRNV